MANTQLFLFERLDVYRVARDALRVVIAYRAKLKGLPGERDCERRSQRGRRHGRDSRSL